MIDRCVICDEYVSEGRQICPWCEQRGTTRMTYYTKCTNCGANLDPDERCDCLEPKCIIIGFDLGQKPDIYKEVRYKNDKHRTNVSRSSQA